MQDIKDYAPMCCNIDKIDLSLLDINKVASIQECFKQYLQKTLAV